LQRWARIIRRVPKVTIVAPCYNSERFVGRTIEAVLAQTLTDWELVVVDDGSTDRSAAVVEQYLDRGPIRLVRQPNQGVARARSNGAVAGSGEYLWFLDADDVPEPHALERFVTYLDAHPEVGLVHSGRTTIDEGDKRADNTPFHALRFVPCGPTARELQPAEPRTPFVSVFCFAVIIPSICVLRRNVYDRTPGWDPGIGHGCEETDLYLHVTYLAEVHFLPELLVRYRRHANQASQDTGHLDRQKRRLHRKWTTSQALTERQRKDAANALLFYEGRVQPMLRLMWAADHLGNGNIREATRCCLRSLKLLGRYLMVRVRHGRSAGTVLLSQ
jgi:glycosyltransferase involved in cell wall biosynthesis